MHFWPDANGTMRDAHQRIVSGATQTILMPPHVRYAQANGLLDPATSAAVLGTASQLSQGTASAYAHSAAALNRAVGPYRAIGLGYQQTPANQAYLARHHLALR
jgi:hypothetical protein